MVGGRAWQGVTALSVLLVAEPPGRIVGGRILFRKNLLELPPAGVARSRQGDLDDLPGAHESLNPVTCGSRSSRRSCCKKLDRRARSPRIEMLRLVGIPAPGRRVDSIRTGVGRRRRASVAMALACQPSI